MANFIYTKSDLNKDLVTFLGGSDLNITNFGLDDIDYFKISELEYYVTQSKNLIEINDDLVKNYGFDDVKVFLDYFCRAHLWNNYICLKNQTLRDFLRFYYNKARKYHSYENIPVPDYDGNVLNYLKQFRPQWLLSIGW